METYRGHVRNPADAIKLFEACRLGLLPRVQRRLSEKERQSIQSGSVFVWDEREAGMRRWTDGKSWSASRVSGSFLTYREMEGKRGGGNFVPAPRRLGGKTPDSGRGSDEDADMDADGPDGYRYKADGLMKQSFSITTSTGQHLHLISYYTPRPHSSMADLPQPTTDPALRQIIPVKGMYPESTVHDSAPPIRTAPMPSSYMSLGQQMPVGPPPQALGRAPYPYPQGYGPWPPSPMATPPYNYPPAMYASQLPLPANGHPAAYPQYLPPHLQHHLPPQSYDRPSPLSLLPNTHDSIHRFPGQLPQMSAQPYGTSSYNGGERHLSEPSIQQRPMAYMNQMPGVDNRLPPPLQHQNSAPQQSQTNGHHLQREPSSQGREQTSQQSQQSPRINAILNSPKMDQATSIPSISNLVHAAEGPDTSISVPAASARQPSPAPTAQEAAPQPQILASPGPIQLSDSTRRISLVDVQQIAQAADAARKATTPTRGSASLATAAAVAAIELTGAKTPEITSAETTESATPKEAGAPQDIPHERLSFPGGAGAEDMRAIRVLDRKFCI